ncbi:hypothetical protein JOD54_005757 [Actinokineospora baliensis]|nr:hypothetical protein [Actinokineospora baliensis]
MWSQVHLTNAEAFGGGTLAWEPPSQRLSSPSSRARTRYPPWRGIALIHNGFTCPQARFRHPLTAIAPASLETGAARSVDLAFPDVRRPPITGAPHQSGNRVPRPVPPRP